MEDYQDNPSKYIQENNSDSRITILVKIFIGILLVLLSVTGFWSWSSYNRSVMKEADPSYSIEDKSSDPETLIVTEEAQQVKLNNEIILGITQNNSVECPALTNRLLYQDIEPMFDGRFVGYHSSPDVAGLNHFLQATGYLVDRYKDSEFGTSTRQAVIAFQSDVGIFIDGVVGPQTKTAIEQVCKGSVMSPFSAAVFFDMEYVSAILEYYDAETGTHKHPTAGFPAISTFSGTRLYRNIAVDGKNIAYIDTRTKYEGDENNYSRPCDIRLMDAQTGEDKSLIFLKNCAAAHGPYTTVYSVDTKNRTFLLKQAYGESGYSSISVQTRSLDTGQIISAEGANLDTWCNNGKECTDVELQNNEEFKALQSKYPEPAARFPRVIESGEQFICGNVTVTAEAGTHFKIQSPAGEEVILNKEFLGCITSE